MSTIRCTKCKQSNLGQDAWVDPDTLDVKGGPYDTFYCFTCEEECTVEEVKTFSDWLTVHEDAVRHVWVCTRCENGDGDYEMVRPDYYAESGTPVCSCCDRDMSYVRTEVFVPLLRRMLDAESGS